MCKETVLVDVVRVMGPFQTEEETKKKNGRKNEWTPVQVMGLRTSRLGVGSWGGLVLFLSYRSDFMSPSHNVFFL